MMAFAFAQAQCSQVRKSEKKTECLCICLCVSMCTRARVQLTQCICILGLLITCYIIVACSINFRENHITYSNTSFSNRSSNEPALMKNTEWCTSKRK